MLAWMIFAGGSDVDRPVSENVDDVKTFLCSPGGCQASKLRTFVDRWTTDRISEAVRSELVGVCAAEKTFHATDERANCAIALFSVLLLPSSMTSEDKSLAMSLGQLRRFWPELTIEFLV